MADFPPLVSGIEDASCKKIEIASAGGVKLAMPEVLGTYSRYFKLANERIFYDKDRGNNYGILALNDKEYNNTTPFVVRKL